MGQNSLFPSPLAPHLVQRELIMSSEELEVTVFVHSLAL